MKLRFIPLAMLTIASLVLAGCTDADESAGGDDPYADGTGADQSGGGSVSGTIDVEEGGSTNGTSNDTATNDTATTTEG